MWKSVCAKVWSLQNFQTLQIKSQLKNPFAKWVIWNRQNFKIWVPACKEKKSFVFICRLAKSGKKVLSAACVVRLISADNGGPVARGKEPFLCSFLDIEISKFRKDLLLFFLVIEFDFRGKFAFEGNVEFTKPPLPFLNCNCQHSRERKILLSKVNRKTLFWMLWSLFLPSKKWTLGFCQILKGSCSKTIGKTPS